MSKMVQVFMVLRCFSCETFQVHQVKKSSNKWQCKICNEKQSVKKVYGQGTAGNCRQHVQKLNMQRGEKEALEQQMLNHPPEDYAATFDEEHHHGDDPTPEHPVLLTGKGSRWNLYTEPQDSTSEEETEEANESGLYTTDRGEFEHARKKTGRDLKRHGSDSSKPHPLSKAARGDSLMYKPPNVSHSHTPIHPYSSVSGDMDLVLSGIKSSESCYLYSSNERYQKLDSSSHDFPTNKKVSQSVQNLTTFRSSNSDSPSLKPRQFWTSKEDQISSIRDDIGRFSKNGTSKDSVIPVASSRWSKFMNESEDGEREGEEGGGEVGEGGESEGVRMHMLQSKMAVAKYN